MVRNGVASRATAAKALENRQQTILMAVRVAISGAAAAGLTYVVVEYNLSGSAGATLVDEGFSVTLGDDTKYEVDWTP